MKYAFYRQLDAKDCGPACLRMICKYYGKSFSPQFLRNRCFANKTGSNMLCISDGAESIGIHTTGGQVTFDRLSTHIQLPCIIRWNKHHFVVVYGFTKNRVIVGDPSIGILKYKKQFFMNCWHSHKNENGDWVGVVMILEPKSEFYSQNDIKNNIKFNNVFKYLGVHKKQLAQLSLFFLIGSLINLIFPFLTQSIVDFGIADNSINFIITILLAQVALTVGAAANRFISSWLMLHISSRISISMINDFLGKLMKLSISFFDKRMLGDLLQRIGDFGRIEKFLTTSLISITLAIIGFIAFGILLGGYGKWLLVTFLTGSILYVMWILLFMKKRRKLDYMRFQETANSQSNIIHLINGMQEIKLNNCEKYKREEWQNIQLKLYDINTKGLTLSQSQDIGGLFIDQIKNVIISFLAASAVVKGEMTLGMMMAVQYIVGQMSTPLFQVIDFMQSTQDTKISMERVNEINMSDDEELSNKNKALDIPIHANIEVSNLSFHYNGPRSPKVLDNISFEIGGGKITAIVGASGSGKTTLLKLLLGFYKPTQGQIDIDKNNMNIYNVNKWRQYCGVVMQEGFIFSDTIAKNIALTDEIPDLEKVIFASKVACMHDFVSKLTLGYNTIIGSDGNSLSTGQKQRVLIARAVYKNAPYIFLDEATNSLDANNELCIMKNLNKFYEGKTVVVIAHRLSTVKQADKIIVLDNGRIVEEGNHINLINKQGYYFNLIKNQLELGS